ncbi:hypothetical protein A3194_12540 [Candidatus Thiodiazotropha endoloripes]|uniref:hypothetical protein n=1 Tax=Candidatus Thiodiazotropha endoloripes TaxID=1818881 RepID=UPI0008692CB6|nr:hypothetical protein [Candidatus Thiodiazotropha endoloripes]ODB85655.1 hypothetical protein A3194_12540 [Candidatus Thiodiazotropha endoloripes]
MKVKCVKLVDRATGNPVDRDDWLTVGKSYNVVFIEKPKDGSELFRIVGDDASKKPLLFDASSFEILEEVDGSWVSETSPSGTLRIGPREFMSPGFWGNLFEGEIQEKKIFEEVVSSLNC